MLSKHKNTHILAALLICGVALTALALQSGQIHWMKSGKTDAAPKAKIKSALPSARAAAAPAPMIMFQGPGIAPTRDPGTGFDIAGDLRANDPHANTTDWVPGLAGTGVGVMTAAGIPVDATKTFHLIDTFNDQNDNIFSGGKKLDDDPNTWTWTNQKPTG